MVPPRHILPGLSHHRAERLIHLDVNPVQCLKPEHVRYTVYGRIQVGPGHVIIVAQLNLFHHAFQAYLNIIPDKGRLPKLIRSPKFFRRQRAYALAAAAEYERGFRCTLGAQLRGRHRVVQIPYEKPALPHNFLICLRRHCDFMCKMLQWFERTDQLREHGILAENRYLHPASVHMISSPRNISFYQMYII